MKLRTRICIGLAIFILLCLLGGWFAYLVVVHHFESELPPVSETQNIQLAEPLRIYTADGKLIAQFGAKLRKPLKYEKIPKTLRQAFMAAEDNNFFNHGAVDIPGLMRAAYVLITTGEKKQGGSTITMQLARDLFLSPRKTYSRKIKEILLARRLEKTYSKQQILALYLNRIFLGHHAYGVAAAAHVYYGKDVDQLSLSQAATLAGLPKAPSTDNPVTNPQRATGRRNYVLGQMHQLGWISDADYQHALQQPVTAQLQRSQPQVTASYAAEMVRAKLIAKYGEAIYHSGDSVITTINSKDQAAAVNALRAGLLAYGQRHAYIGPEGHLPKELIAKLKRNPADPDVLSALNDKAVVGGLVAAAVVSFSPSRLVVQTASGQATLPAKAFAWTKLSAQHPLHPGDIVRLLPNGKGWTLAEIPPAQGALVALDPNDGAIRALVGGFDFSDSKYNRAVQAQRQVGSGFKPYLYTAALAKGYTPASTFLNAPVVTGGGSANAWRPQNDNGKFGGLMRMRSALEHSVNLVSIRILRAIGVDYMRGFVSSRFGIPAERIPDNLTAALGTAALTPLEQARGYAVFANGGFLVSPYLIKSIRNQDGEEIFHAKPSHACRTCPFTGIAANTQATPVPVLAPVPQTETGGNAPRTLTPPTNYLIDSMLHDVIRHGTGHAATALGRHDLDGKTGTTNNYTDAWFNGFNPSLVAIAWVGHDSPTSLGSGEFGSKAALPIWMAFMKRALAGAPEHPLEMPTTGISEITIDPATGNRVPPGTSGAIGEVVQSDHLPPMEYQSPGSTSAPARQLY